LNIVLLGHREFASNLALSLVVDQLCGHNLHLFVSGEHTFSGDTCHAIRELEHFEDRLCDEIALGAMARRAEKAGLLSFDAMAEVMGKPVEVLAEPNSTSGLEMLRATEPDLLLSLRYRRILHRDAIALPRYGVLNWHSGLLPGYRGVMATFWAMLNGDEQIGSTCHAIIDRGIDTGPLVNTAPIQCRYDHTYLSNVYSLYLAGHRMVVDAVEVIARSATAAPKPQLGDAHYYHAPSQEDVDRFETHGYRLHDGDELNRLLDVYPRAQSRR